MHNIKLYQITFLVELNKIQIWLFIKYTYMYILYIRYTQKNLKIYTYICNMNMYIKYDTIYIIYVIGTTQYQIIFKVDDLQCLIF